MVLEVRVVATLGGGFRTGSGDEGTLYAAGDGNRAIEMPQSSLVLLGFSHFS